MHQVSSGAADTFFARLRQGLHDLGALPKALRIAWSAARSQAVAWMALLILEALLPAFLFYIIRALVNAVTGGISEFEDLVPLLAGLAMVLVVREGAGAMSGLVRVSLGERVLDHIKSRIHDTATKVDYAHFESPEFYDQLHRANYEAGDATIAVIESVGSSLRGVVSLGAMMLILFPYAAWLPVVLLISMGPIAFVVVSHAYRYHLWWKIATTRERRASYYDWLMTSSEAAAEIRLFQIGDRLKETYQSLRHTLRGERMSLERQNALAVGIASLITVLITSGALLAIFLRVLAGSLTIGDLVLCYQAFNQGHSVARTLVSEFGSILRSSLYMTGLMEFLEIRPTVASPDQTTAFPAPITSGIVFKNVTFTYPGANRPVLRDFSLNLPANQMTVIVGMNGVGKSTLLKLICRFYDPQAGTIELDGINLKHLNLEQLRKSISVLFQDPVQYQFTAAENIDIDLSRNRDDVIKAACRAKADQCIIRLPQGYDSLLGKWFLDGHELSGGEWQRVALARAVLQDRPILILDEPTSAMDPWMEAEWLDRLEPVTARKTAIIITHRLSVALRADHICVLGDGKVLEEGTHESLLSDSESHYSLAWQNQRRSLG